MEQNTKWVQTLIDIGKIKESSSHEIQFLYSGTCLPHKVQIHPSCGCTNARWIPENRELKVTLKAGKVPQHLEVQELKITKSIKFIYICDGIEAQDILKITGIIVK